MRHLVTHPGCGFTANEHCDRSLNYDIRRPDADGHITNDGRGCAANQDGRTTRTRNRAAYMRYGRKTWREHGTYMHISNSGCRAAHQIFFIRLTDSSGYWVLQQAAPEPIYFLLLPVR